MVVIILIGFFLAYGLNLFFITQENKYGCFITKLLLTPTLYHFYVYKSNYPVIIVFFALLFCFFGDFFMELGEKKHWLLAGLNSFLLGHIFYIICFYRQITKPVPPWIFVFLIFYVVYAFGFYKILNVADEKLKTAIVLYCIVIIMMSFFALLRVRSVSAGRFILTYLGSLFFIASDSILAYNMFVRKIKNSGLWIMSTYGIAQLLIVSGL